MNITLDTAYKRRLYLDTILSQNLSESKFTICADYNWADPARIMGVTVRGNTLYLTINVNTMSDKTQLFAHNKHRGELQMLFCANYIINYIHCLEGAYTTVPDSYFAGLAVMESVLDLNCEKPVICTSPFAKGKFRNLRPLDVYCAVRALNSLLMDKAELLTKEDEAVCRQALDLLVMYTGSPEVMYAKGTVPRYSLLCDFSQVMNLIENKPEVTRHFPLVSRIRGVFSEDEDIREMLRDCDLRGDRFLAGVFVRLCAFTRKKGYLQGYLGFCCVRDAINEFHQGAEDWLGNISETSKFLRDNSEAVKELLFMTDLVSGSYSDENTSRTHYIQ